MIGARIAMLAFMLVAIPWTPRAARAQTEPPIAIVNAHVWHGDGSTVENATIVVRDQRIRSVTPGGQVPSGATRIDAEGRTVTAGFVGLQSAIGLVEISLEPETRDLSPEREDADVIRAAFSAADGYNPRSTLVAVARLGGVTSALSTPQEGLVSGTSAWVDLDGERPGDAIARAVVAVHVNLDEGGVRSAGGAMPMALTRLRELLDDARLYGRNRAAFDRRSLRAMRVSRLDLERLQDALTRRIPVVVRVSRAADILRALNVAQEYGLRVVLAGVEDGWRVADRIAAADVPVIVQPLRNLPSSFSRLGSRYDNAAMLSRAGVRVLIRTDGAHGLRNLRQEAGNAVAHGLDRNDALRALTSEPARVFGMADDYGSIAPGRVANLVIWSGDPFEVTTWPVRTFIRGRDVPQRSRQTALFERYRDLDRVNRGVVREAVE